MKRRFVPRAPNRARTLRLVLAGGAIASQLTVSSAGRAQARVGSEVHRTSLSSSSRAPCRVDRGRRTLAIGAAVVPGAVVHGAGHFVACERETAKKLALAEAAGVGALLTSGVLLLLTGASQYVVAPLAVGAVTGGSVFGLSYLADVYGVVADNDQAAPRAARLRVEAGFSYVYDPHFSYRTFISQGFRLQEGRYWLAPQIMSSLDAHNRRYGARAGYRVLGGARPTQVASISRLAPRSWLDVALGAYDHGYGESGFSLTGVEAALLGHLELSALGARTLRGAFAEGELGYARLWTRFDGLPDLPNDQLLARFMFGFYWGRGQALEGQTQFGYDHRRDTLAGGLKPAGIAAG
ncbi:MAG TPA: hypothetical protein VFQ61_18515, partial [Polyangiaceae bacterium]|nr:hypothetical protein [Polyangiaceae bacterium]